MANDQFCHRRQWTVTNQAEAASALCQINAGRRPDYVRIVSSPAEPLRCLHEILRGLGSACTGDLEVKILESFWRPNPEMDAQLHAFINIYSSKVLSFYGSPELALRAFHARGRSNLFLGVRLSSLADVGTCQALANHPRSICCLRGLPAEAGVRFAELGWKPAFWHFPDLRDGEVDWVCSLISPSLSRVWWSLLYLPGCGLTEEQFSILLDKKLPGRNFSIFCECSSLSAEAQTRLAELAQQKEITLQWTLPLDQIF